jgi:hypothetical protein
VRELFEQQLVHTRKGRSGLGDQYRGLDLVILIAEPNDQARHTRDLSHASTFAERLNWESGTGVHYDTHN